MSSRNKAKTYKLHDFVFVNPSRGKTPGMARVSRIFPEEAEIVFDNGQTERFYFAHLYQTFECHGARKKFLAERADKVGR